AIFFKKEMIVLIYFLLLAILFLPLTQIYEDTRFKILRPKMEQVALQIAKEYQYTDSKTIDIDHIKLPKEYAYLSRSKTVNCILNESGIEVAFYKWPGLLGDSMQYIYSTNIPYKGKCLDTYSQAWDFFSIAENKTIYRNWEYLQTKD
ncbi:MAG: hypothetical protein Q8882_04620, partial [Bacillota bacterium]|nr:hypothetical protein [Bacillota bacterium]